MINLIEYSEVLDFLEKMGELIAETFGENCEVAISDINNPDASIIYIFNGHVTNRRAGDPLVPIALERYKSNADDIYVNYSGLKSGKDIKSSSLTFKLGKHHLSFCINYDYSALIPAQRLLSQLSEARNDTAPAGGVISSADTVIEEAIMRCGKPPRLMTKEDRVNIVSYLNEQGVFNIQRSVITTAKRLGISRFTVYNYLNEINAISKNGETSN